MVAPLAKPGATFFDTSVNEVSFGGGGRIGQALTIYKEDNRIRLLKYYKKKFLR